MEIRKHLIKCKDCKWQEEKIRDGILWCTIWYKETNELDDCAYAARRGYEGFFQGEGGEE